MCETIQDVEQRRKDMKNARKNKKSENKQNNSIPKLTVNDLKDGDKENGGYQKNELDDVDDNENIVDKNGVDNKGFNETSEGDDSKVNQSTFKQDTTV